MKYISVLILLIFIGCNNDKTKNKLYIKDIVKTSEINGSMKNTIIIKDLIFKIINNKLEYNFDSSKILLFKDNSNYSSLQIKVLKKLHLNYYIIQNPRLIQYFKIQKYPTIIITKDTNNTKKYEGFIPAEILKYEIKD